MGKVIKIKKGKEEGEHNRKKRGISSRIIRNTYQQIHVEKGTDPLHLRSGQELNCS